MTAGSGLRRFVGPAPAPPPDAQSEKVERCEMCGEPAGNPHGHVVDVTNRRLLCACRPCYLLFTRPDAGGGRLRAVPDRYASDPAHPIGRAEWDRLGIPVGSVFLLRGENGVTAFYPSPAGATECLLDLDALADLAKNHPLLSAAEDEVEAVLVRAESDTDPVDSYVDAYVVPIDACYELVGTVRLYWRGFDGGPEARSAIDAFYDRVRAAARPLAEG